MREMECRITQFFAALLSLLLLSPLSFYNMHGYNDTVFCFLGGNLKSVKNDSKVSFLPAQMWTSDFYPDLTLKEWNWTLTEYPLRLRKNRLPIQVRQPLKESK